MNRRTVLTGSGALLSAVIAGCTGSNSNNSNDEESSDAGTDSQYVDSSETDASGSNNSDESNQSDTEDEQDTDEAITPAEGVLEVTDINADSDPDEEYVEFTNTADDPVDLTGAYVRDGEGGRVDNGRSPFRFSEDIAVLQPDESIRLWSGDGMNTMYEVYWKYSVSMWDEEGDTIIVVYNNERVLEHTYEGTEASSQENETESSAQEDS